MVLNINARVSLSGCLIYSMAGLVLARATKVMVAYGAQIAEPNAFRVQFHLSYYVVYRDPPPKIIKNPIGAELPA